MLALAREIRKPRAYVGYSAFVLMGLAMECQPCTWEGSSFSNLLATYIPWAMEHCTKQLHVSAVCCGLVAQANGSVECVVISDEHPLSEVKHFVCGINVITNFGIRSRGEYVSLRCVLCESWGVNYSNCLRWGLRIGRHG